ncbi:hypothetical protein D3C73_1285770 [compost metagenome]
MDSNSVTLAPKASMVSVRSRVDDAGMTSSRFKPYIPAIMASAIPVFPLVASISLLSFEISPRSMAERIIFKAARSLTEPAGLFPSIFAKIRTLVFA